MGHPARFGRSVGLKLAGVLGVGDGDWGWGMGNGEWGWERRRRHWASLAAFGPERERERGGGGGVKEGGDVLLLLRLRDEGGVGVGGEHVLLVVIINFFPVVGVCLQRSVWFGGVRCALQSGLLLLLSKGVGWNVLNGIQACGDDV